MQNVQKLTKKTQCFFWKNKDVIFCSKQLRRKYLLTAAKSTHGFDGFDRPIYIFAQKRVAQKFADPKITFNNTFVQFH